LLESFNIHNLSFLNVFKIKVKLLNYTEITENQYLNQ
jgi:hypothetical protein